MPKKTKKEKMLAQKHRGTVLSSPGTTIPSPLTHQSSSVQFTLPSIKTTRVSQTTHGLVIEEFSAIKRDLLKTIIITVGIIVTELLLSHYLPH
jgi:hypothetical protein